jgi:hypothetical protein
MPSAIGAGVGLIRSYQVVGEAPVAGSRLPEVARTDTLRFYMSFVYR